MQAKDIPDLPVLAFLALRPGTWHNWAGAEYPNSVTHAMPAGTPQKLVLAKMRTLIRRELVSGCACGCRGDFEIAPKGQALVKEQDISAARAIAPPWFVCAACGREQHYDGPCFECNMRRVVANIRRA